MKNRPFLSRKVSLFYIITVILCWPYWGLEIYANFTYFNNINKIFLKTRPLEPLFRSVTSSDSTPRTAFLSIGYQVANTAYQQ